VTREIGPGPQDRAVIIGKTGSGKSTLAEQLVIQSGAPHVVVHDAKGMLRWNGFFRFTKLDDLMRANVPRMIYAPDHSELIDEGACNTFFQWVYINKNRTLYVDEVYSVTKRNEIPQYYHAILTRGREYNIRTISSSQRPSLIPQVILSETDHAYIFRLLLLPDRKKIKSMFPLSDKQLEKINKHAFWYANAEGDIVGPLILTL
jgi:hypothetical protein